MDFQLIVSFVCFEWLRDYMLLHSVGYMVYIYILCACACFFLCFILRLFFLHLIIFALLFCSFEWKLWKCVSERASSFIQWPACCFTLCCEECMQINRSICLLNGLANSVVYWTEIRYIQCVDLDIDTCLLHIVISIRTNARRWFLPLIQNGLFTHKYSKCIACIQSTIVAVRNGTDEAHDYYVQVHINLYAFCNAFNYTICYYY